MDKAVFLSGISPPLDSVLAEALIREFVDVERRFVLGDWEPATLDGGQFAEIAARIVYHLDSGNLNRRKPVDDCLAYVEEDKGQNKHAFTNRRASLHLCKVLRTLYKLRSQRGAIHIDPDYTANEMDSTLVLALVRWTMSEFLRLFWVKAKADLAAMIREIVKYEVPAVFCVDGRAYVLRTDCTAHEEILIVLHNAGEKGMSRNAIGVAVQKSAPMVTQALQALASPSFRQVIQRTDKTYTLTPNGTRRVLQELGGKLALG